MRACTLPGSRRRSTLSTATTPGKRLLIPVISRASVALSATASTASAAIAAPPHEVEPGGNDEDDAGDDHLQVLAPLQHDDAVVDHLEDEDAEQRADERPAAARQAGAAEDARGRSDPRGRAA